MLLEEPVTSLAGRSRLRGALDGSAPDPRELTADDGGIATYNIYRSTSASGSFAKVSSTTKLGYTDSGLKAGQTYYANAADKAGNHGMASITVSATAL